MAPFKSSLAKSAGKLLGVFREADLSLRGATQSSRFREIVFVDITLTNSASNNTGGGNNYITWTSSGAFAIDGPGLSNPIFKIDYLLIGGGGGTGGFASGVGYFNGTAGVDSTALGVRAAGGGQGSRYPGVAGGAGGSGGGGGAPTGTAGAGNLYNPISPAHPGPAPGQGNPGGTGAGGGLYGGSGGGGAGQAGEGSKPNSQSGYGGYGKAAFSGDTNFPTTYGTPGPSAGRWFAGGGGGAGGTPNPSGGAHNAPGGAGGGGNGVNATPYAASVATVNSGGGAGVICESGGGGASGAGAGGYLEATNQSISAATYPIVIGGGGSAPSGTAAGTGATGGSGIFVLKIPSAAQTDIQVNFS